MSDLTTSPCCAPSCCAPKSEAKPDTRAHIRATYAAAATQGAGCGCGSAPEEIAALLGYDAEELGSLPEGANMGLSCGNPKALAALKAGEVVLDLGSGGGFDAFLAAREVGEAGRVIGVDMTPEMITLARRNAEKAQTHNVDFYLGEIERLPVPDGIIDVVISNCVINLSSDKPQVFREAARVLRPGGRLCVSDVVALAPLPEAFREDPRVVASCIGGAASIDELRAGLEAAGFEEIEVEIDDHSKALVEAWGGGGAPIASARISARRP